MKRSQDETDNHQVNLCDSDGEDEKRALLCMVEKIIPARQTEEPPSKKSSSVEETVNNEHVSEVEVDKLVNEKEEVADLGSTKLFCKLCGVNSSSILAARDHYRGKKHLKKVFGSSEKGHIHAKKNEQKVNVVTVPEVELHDVTKSVKQRILEGENPLYCALCNTASPNINCANAHLKGKKHLKKLVSLQPVGNYPLQCDICSTNPIKSMGGSEAMRHFEGKQHKKVVAEQSIATNAGEPGGELPWKCDTCGEQFVSTTEAKEHLEAGDHKRRVDSCKEEKTRKVRDSNEIKYKRSSNPYADAITPGIDYSDFRNHHPSSNRFGPNPLEFLGNPNLLYQSMKFNRFSNPNMVFNKFENSEMDFNRFGSSHNELNKFSVDEARYDNFYSKRRFPEPVPTRPIFDHMHRNGGNNSYTANLGNPSGKCGNIARGHQTSDLNVKDTSGNLTSDENTNDKDPKLLINNESKSVMNPIWLDI